MITWPSYQPMLFECLDVYLIIVDHPETYVTALINGLMWIQALHIEIGMLNGIWKLKAWIVWRPKISKWKFGLSNSIEQEFHGFLICYFIEWFNCTYLLLYKF